MILFLIVSCFDKKEGKKVYNIDEIISEMYISDISYFSVNGGYMTLSVDSISRKYGCIYSVRFRNRLITGENDFTFIDSIGKYNLDDKFPKIK